MYTRKKRVELLTIPDFHKAHPDISETKIRGALRNRDANGFHKCVWFTLVGHRKVMLDVERTAAYFRAVVRA